MELVCSLYRVGRFGVFLSHMAPGFQLWFYFHLYMCVMGFAPEAALEDLGLPLRARRGGGAAAWIAGVLAAPGTQESWQLGQQEIKCSRRVWQQVLANTLQHSYLEIPSP